MKNLLMGLGIALCTISQPLLAHKHHKPAFNSVKIIPVKFDIIPFENLTAAQLEQFKNKKNWPKKQIVQCTEGTLVPFEISLTEELLAVEPAEAAKLSLKCQKTFYLKPHRSHYHYSFDAVKWYRFNPIAMDIELPVEASEVSDISEEVKAIVPALEEVEAINVEEAEIIVPTVINEESPVVVTVEETLKFDSDAAIDEEIENMFKTR